MPQIQTQHNFGTIMAIFKNKVGGRQSYKAVDFRVNR